MAELSNEHRADACSEADARNKMAVHVPFGKRGQPFDMVVDGDADGGVVRQAA
ncbi:hypothetical protein [Arthrobacter sp. NicSoilB8]|uniref:hypothetical protein n=1 Tax=Arthrobacter sp. NicSoilB8 TaxID=2830998 RepID=UPI001CC4C1D9|nr:hypothetical protein [Arthrobacter sp. NicSoilB8]BCW69905.1 hypothetical protein NicSoilB8_09490 [Arthrobacter sp. NicSoilB8]